MPPVGKSRISIVTLAAWRIPARPALYYQGLCTSVAPTKYQRRPLLGTPVSRTHLARATDTRTPAAWSRLLSFQDYMAKRQSSVEVPQVCSASRGSGNVTPMGYLLPVLYRHSAALLAQDGTTDGLGLGCEPGLLALDHALAGGVGGGAGGCGRS